MKKKYYFTDIIRRLETLLQWEVGMQGFKILLYGWRIKQPFCSRSCSRGSPRKGSDEDLRRPSRFRSLEGRPERQDHDERVPLESLRRGVRSGTPRVSRMYKGTMYNVRKRKNRPIWRALKNFF